MRKMVCSKCKEIKPDTEFSPSKRKWRSDWCKKCDAQYQKEKYYKYKKRVFDAYGGFRCVCCDITNPVFLTIDHINGNGNKHRKSIGANASGCHMYAWLVKNNFPEGYQVLCWNCNHAKHVDGTCPHQNIKRTQKLGDIWH
jgi:hypothetical protein